MAAIQDVQKKIDTKFRTLKLLEKGTLRTYERTLVSGINGWVKILLKVNKRGGWKFCLK